MRRFKPIGRFELTVPREQEAIFEFLAAQTEHELATADIAYPVTETCYRVAFSDGFISYHEFVSLLAIVVLLGKTEHLAYLLEKVKEQGETLPFIYQQLKKLVIRACEYGQIGVLRQLLNFSPPHNHLIVQPNYLSNCLAQACENGHFEVVKYLSEQFPEHISAMISENRFDAFRRACESGNLELVKLLIRLSNLPVKHLIKGEYLPPFLNACRWGNWETVHFLIKEAGEMIEEIVTCENYLAFNSTFQNPDGRVTTYLLNLFPSHKLNMLKSIPFKMIEDACSEGNLSLIKMLVEQYGDEKDYFMSLIDLRVILRVLIREHTWVVTFLLSNHPDPKSIIASNQYKFLHFANLVNHQCSLDEIAKYLANHPNLTPVEELDAHAKACLFKIAQKTRDVVSKTKLLEKLSGKVDSPTTELSNVQPSNTALFTPARQQDSKQKVCQQNSLAGALKLSRQPLVQSTEQLKTSQALHQRLHQKRKSNFGSTD